MMLEGDVLKNEHYIRIMKNSIFKIMRQEAIKRFILNYNGSIHDMLDYVNNKIIEHDGKTIGLRAIQKDIKQLKSDQNLQIDRYKPTSNELIAKYGRKGKKQYSHGKDPIVLSSIFFLRLREGSSVSEKLSFEEQKTLSDAAIVLSRFQGKAGFEMIDDVIDGLNDCANFVDLLLENKITNQENKAYRKKEYLKIKEALMLNKPLSVKIGQEFSNKEKTIEFHPHHLKMWNSMWYAYGFSKDVDFNPYVLPINLLLKDVKFLNKKFIKSKISYSNSDGTTFFDDIVGVTNYIDKNAENIVLKATDKGRYYRMKRKPIHHTCEFDDKYYKISLKVKINPELINFIMEHIDEVEVIEPASLRDELSKKLNNISQSYKTNL